MKNKNTCPECGQILWLTRNGLPCCINRDCEEFVIEAKETFDGLIQKVDIENL